MILKLGDLPAELCVRPTAFVALTGLDIVHNAVHKAVYDSFSTNRRADRVPISFRVLDGDHEYPKPKQKRTTYEWYVPKGILKTNWMEKHLYYLPSLVVVFYDLDWDDPMWNEKQMECATRVEIVRTALESRATKVAVVLIQKNAPLPPGEEDLTTKRAAALCAACELSAKSLFVLPPTDHLSGYTLRLENAFYELSQNYYQHEIKRIKSHHDDLNKTTHQLLYVRHQFKIAFLNELKQDNPTALKHYKQAYANLIEVRAHDLNMLEIKTVAGFLNYKICRLSFQLNTPLDSISQFRKHVNVFKYKVGPRELAFEHSAWMSKQFSIFGDLFDEAIKMGLTAIQTQHPGFYYQQAAYHSITRKLLCQELCRNIKELTYPSDDPLAGMDALEFFGQRPWRPAMQSFEPPDAEREREGILSLQFKEATEVDHSMTIIPLLSSAVSQFKKYKCPRMKRFLLVQMGEEYYHTKEYERALTLLTHVMWDYRWERWWKLLLSIQWMALRCAYLVANMQEYTTLTLEVLSKWIQFPPDDKERIQINLNKIIAGDVPDPEPGCPEECTQKALSFWQSLMKDPEPKLFTIEMNNIIPFVDCQAWFSEPVFQADHLVMIEVCIRTCCPLPIRFSKLSVLFSNQCYNEFCEVRDVKGSSPQVEKDLDSHHQFDLIVEPGRPKFHSFSFVPQPDDLHRKIEISGLLLQLGDEAKHCVILHWAVGGELAFQRPSWNPWRNTSCWKVDNDSTLPVQLNTRIIPRESCMKIVIHHESPALVNEFYLLQIEITNNEPVTATNVRFSVGLKDDQEIALQTSTHISLDTPVFVDEAIEKIEGIKLDDLSPGAEIRKMVYMKAFQTGTRNLFIQITYDVEVAVGDQLLVCSCTKEEEIIVPTVKTFDITVKQVNMKFEHLSEIRAKEPFIILIEIECISPWPVIIKTSSVGLNPVMKYVDKEIVSQLDKVELQSRFRAVECVCLVADEPVADPVLFGTYTLQWRRKTSAANIPVINSTISLPSGTVSPASIYVEADLPAHGWTRTPLTAIYILHNYTAFVQDFELTVESSNGFMFSGQKQLHFRVMPHGQRKFTYILYPLIAGYVALPKLRLSLTQNSEMQTVLDEVMETMLPAHIFIMPKGKTIADINDEFSGRGS